MHLRPTNKPMPRLHVRHFPMHMVAIFGAICILCVVCLLIIQPSLTLNITLNVDMSNMINVLILFYIVSMRHSHEIDEGAGRFAGFPTTRYTSNKGANNDMDEVMQNMTAAVAEAEYGIDHGDGGPFGAVIVQDGRIVGSGHNMVLAHNDPTAHGEVSAIRDAGQKLTTFDLSGCELYTTGEPCPMCLAAIMWANIEKVYYGCTIKDNELIGFRDDVFNEKLSIDRSKLYESGMLEQVGRDKCLELFERYKAMDAQNY